MITRRNVAHAVPLCAVLCLISGCASQQLLAIKDRDIRDLRRQNASRQEALIKALKTIESVRTELGAARYERRELEQKVARSSASVQLQQQNIDRLETQKTKLQEQLRQSEIAYERLMHTYQDIKTVLSNTVTELAQTRRNHVATADGLGSTERAAEYTRVRRKLDQLRSQIIRERAARRAAGANRAPPTPGPPREESSPWLWRLTEEPPEVETIEPGRLAIDEGVETKAADSTSDEPHVLSTAFLWTLGAIPGIGLTLLMFIVLVRAMSRPSRETREDHEESSRIRDDADEIDEPPFVDEADEGQDVVEEGASRETGDEQAIELHREPPVDGRESEVKETETRPTEAVHSASSATPEAPAESFVDSLDWLDETAQPPRRRKKYSQDTEAVQMSGSSGVEDPHERGQSTEPEPADPAPEPRKRKKYSQETEAVQMSDFSGLKEPHARARSTEPEPADSAPEPRTPPRERETDDENYTDTQMIERIDTDGLSATQVLSVLDGNAADDGDPSAADLDGFRNQEFTDTAVLDAAPATSPPPEESLKQDEMPTDTQLLPPLLDFEDDSELDEALGGPIDTDEADEGPPDEEADSDSKVLAELEDLMGEKFEEVV